MKPHLSLLFISIIFFACSEDSLRQVCGNMGEGKCYAVPGVSPGVETQEDHEELLNNLDIGECSVGIAICNEEGNIKECQGELLPSRETCNLRDDDCDGTTDEQQDIAPLPGQECNQLGSCSGSIPICVEGTWRCSVLPQSETCNNIDDDCDGTTDNNLIGGEEGEWCYNGPEGTELQGICHAGQTLCSFGKTICVNQQTPLAEDCYPFDEDCDGETNENLVLVSRLADMIIDIDLSGSMYSDIHLVKERLYTLLSGLDPDRYRVGVIHMSAIQGEPTVENVTLGINLTTPQEALNYIRSLSLQGSGSELVGNAINLVCNHLDNSLNLSWRLTAQKYYLAFSDEPPRTNNPLITTQELRILCILNNVIVWNWVGPQTSTAAWNIPVDLDWNEIDKTIEDLRDEEIPVPDPYVCISSN